QQIEERGAAFMLGIDFLGLLHHAKRLVLAAGGDARRASLAEIRDEDRKYAARTWALLLRRREDGVRLLIRHRHLVDDVEELLLRLRREAVDLVSDLPDELLRARGLVFRRDRGAHHVSRALADLWQQAQHLLSLAAVAHVVADGGAKN